MHYASIIFCIFTFVQISNVLSDCVDIGSEFQGKLYIGKLETKRILQKESPYSFRGCVKECWLQHRCKVVTYHKIEMTCDLGDGLLSVLNTSDHNYVTSFRSSWPRILDFAGNCKTNNCSLTERCVSLRSGKHHCVELTCDAGWVVFGIKCYYFQNQGLTWKQAEADCVAHGGHLATVDTRAINNFLTMEKTRRRLPQVMIAANDIINEGDWRWSKFGPKIHYFNWKDDAPDDWHSSEDCCVISYSGKWDDVPCFNALPYVCEKYFL